MLQWALIKLDITTYLQKNLFYILLFYHRNLPTHCHICWYNMYVTYIFSSNAITESSTIPFKCLLYSQIHVLELQLQSFFACMIPFTLTLGFTIILFLIWIEYLTIEFAFTITWNMLNHCLTSFLFVVIWNTLKFIGFFYLEHIFLAEYFKSSTLLQLPLHLSTLIMNG